MTAAVPALAATHFRACPTGSCTLCGGVASSCCNCRLGPKQPYSLVQSNQAPLCCAMIPCRRSWTPAPQHCCRTSIETTSQQPLQGRSSSSSNRCSGGAACASAGQAAWGRQQLQLQQQRPWRWQLLRRERVVVLLAARQQVRMLGPLGGMGTKGGFARVWHLQLLRRRERVATVPQTQAGPTAQMASWAVAAAAAGAGRVAHATHEVACMGCSRQAGQRMGNELGAMFGRQC